MPHLLERLRPEHRPQRAARPPPHLDLAVVELARAQELAQLLARRGRVDGGGAEALPRANPNGSIIGSSGRLRGQQRVEHALLGRLARARLDALAPAPRARARRDDLEQVAHDRLDVASDVADLGELRRLDLHERRAG